MVLVLGISRVVSTLDPFLVSLSEFGLNSFSYVPHPLHDLCGTPQDHLFGTTDLDVV